MTPLLLAILIGHLTAARLSAGGIATMALAVLVVDGGAAVLAGASPLEAAIAAGLVLLGYNFGLLLALGTAVVRASRAG